MTQNEHPPAQRYTFFPKKKRFSFVCWWSSKASSLHKLKTKKQINREHKPYSNADPKELKKSIIKKGEFSFTSIFDWFKIRLLIIVIKNQWSMIALHLHIYFWLFVIIWQHSLALYARSHDQSSNQFREYIVHTQLKLQVTKKKHTQHHRNQINKFGSKRTDIITET